MTKYLSLLGDLYDDAEPCFLTTGTDRVYNRVRRQWYSAASLDAKATAEGYSWPDGEYGVPSAEWAKTHGPAGIEWIVTADIVPTPPEPDPADGGSSDPCPPCPPCPPTAEKAKPEPDPRDSSKTKQAKPKQAAKSK